MPAVLDRQQLLKVSGEIVSNKAIFWQHSDVVDTCRSHGCSG